MGTMNGYLIRIRCPGRRCYNQFCMKNEERTIGKILEKLDVLSDKQDGFSTKLDGFGKKLDQFGNRMDGFETKLDQFGNRMDRFETTQNKLVSKVLDMDAKLDDRVTKKEFNEFKEQNASDHDGMMTMLKRMEQESVMRIVWMRRHDEEIYGIKKHLHLSDAGA